MRPEQRPLGRDAKQLASKTTRSASTPAGGGRAAGSCTPRRTQCIGAGARKREAPKSVERPTPKCRKTWDEDVGPGSESRKQASLPGPGMAEALSLAWAWCAELLEKGRDPEETAEFILRFVWPFHCGCKWINDMVSSRHPLSRIRYLLWFSLEHQCREVGNLRMEMVLFDVSVPEWEEDVVMILRARLRDAHGGFLPLPAVHLCDLPVPQFALARQ